MSHINFIYWFSKQFSKDPIKEKLDLVFDAGVQQVDMNSVISTEKKEIVDSISDSVQGQTQSVEHDDNIPKYKPSDDRFADVEAHVFGEENDKKDE